MGPKTPATATEYSRVFSVRWKLKDRQLDLSHGTKNRKELKTNTDYPVRVLRGEESLCDVVRDDS